MSFLTKVLIYGLLSYGGVKALPQATIWMLKNASEASSRGIVPLTTLHKTISEKRGG